MKSQSTFYQNTIGSYLKTPTHFLLRGAGGFWGFFPLWGLGGFLLFLVGCGAKSETDKKDIKTDKPQPLIVDKVVGIANVEPLDKILPINAEVNGIVTEILIKENQKLQKNQVIIRLQDDIEQAQMRQVQSKIATQQALIQSAQALLAAAKVRTENARVNFERNQKMFAGGAVTQQVLDDSRFNYENLQKEAENQTALVLQQTTKVAELQADLAYYQTLMSKKYIKAPTNGAMLSIDTKLGSSVKNETKLGDFAPEGALMAITEIDELYADKIQIGQKAFIRPQGGSEKLAEGKVVFASPYLKKKSLFSDQADNLEDRRVREVRVELNTGTRVLIGSRVECVISLNSEQ